MTIDFNAYRDHELIPIEEVAEALGLKCENGMFKCPCHDDKHPSMVLDRSGRYNNSFKCFSCNESGSPLQLTMAVKYGINPSTYFQNPKQYKNEMLECVKWIDRYWKGAIISLSDEEKKSRNGLPHISRELLTEIGLEPNFLILTPKVRPIDAKRRREMAEWYLDFQEKDEVITFDLTLLEKLEMVYEHINDYINNIILYRREIFQVFPLINEHGREYIDEVLSKKMEDARVVLVELYEFISKKKEEVIFFNEPLKYKETPTVVRDIWLKDGIPENLRDVFVFQGTNFINKKLCEKEMSGQSSPNFDEPTK